MADQPATTTAAAANRMQDQSVERKLTLLRDICGKWDKFSKQELSDLKNSDDLVTQVVAKAALRASALALAKRLCALGPTAIAQAKRSIYVAEDADLRSARLFGVEALTALSTTAEWREGVRAFVEKRPAAFSQPPRSRKQR